MTGASELEPESRDETLRFLQHIQLGVKKMKVTLLSSKVLLLVLLATAICMSAADTPAVTVKGYVLDSACAFTKGLSKPISKQCATSCANAGSPLVILADDGTIYWPIADTTPSSGQNPKLLPFAGDKITASGKVYQRGGSKAIVIEKIEAQAAQK
jgi:type 1 fimbria pilin